MHGFERTLQVVEVVFEGERLLFIIYSLFAPAALMAQERPNILYIMTDQQTATAMSCAGNEEVHTPNMDRLAQRGVRFSNAYCSMPLSGPSRSSMFTGYTPGQVGLTENGTDIGHVIGRKRIRMRIRREMARAYQFLAGEGGFRFREPARA